MQTLMTRMRTGLAASALFTAMALTAMPVNAADVIEAAVVSLPAPSNTFDPAATVSATDRAAFSLTNGTLFRTEIDGSIVPGLAEKIDYNADFTVGTVTLKPGMKFSDGTPLTAADVAATFTRHMTTQGSVLGAMMNRIEKVEATGDLTAVFTFKGPFPSFPDFSTAGSYGIYPAAAVTGADFFRNPVTAGPYKIASVWSNNKLEVTANENYTAGPAPIVNNITLTVVEDANSAISQLQSGQIQYAGDLPPNYLLQLQGVPGVTVSTVTVYGFYDLRMWNQSGIFADANMRNAVSYALDREAIVRSIWGDTNVPLAGFWPPSMAFYDADQSPKQDLAKARELLAQTACASGCEVRLMYSDQEFAFSSQLALIVQNQLQQVGITVKLERLDAPTLVQRLRAGDYDMVPGAMASAANIPDHLLGNALLGTGPLKAEFTGYNSEAMNALIAKVNQSSGADRAAAAAELEALFVTDRPYATLAPWVRGAATTLPEGTMSLQGTGFVVGSQQ
jgi:peptide/nickel transport system substrate-binding protein